MGCYLSATGGNDTVGRWKVSFDLCRKFRSCRGNSSGKTDPFDFGDFCCFGNSFGFTGTEKNPPGAGACLRCLCADSSVSRGLPSLRSFTFKSGGKALFLSVCFRNGKQRQPAPPANPGNHLFPAQKQETKMEKRNFLSSHFCSYCRNDTCIVCIRRLRRNCFFTWKNHRES